MVKLILVRHALTVDNQKSRLSGHIDSSISEEGKEQIDKITNYLKDFDIDKIYTTTSSRTKDTVKKLSELKSIEIIEKESLKEISFGDFEGLTFDEIKDKYPKEFQDMIEKGLPKVDTIICSYAIHLCCKSMLPMLLYSLSQSSDNLIIISPSDSLEIKHYWKLKNHVKHNRTHWRQYEH